MSECIYILLPVHNRKNVTQIFVESLLAQTLRNYHLILIDDGSTDGTTRMVRSAITSDSLTVIKGNGKWWWAGSLQRGIDWLKRKDCFPEDMLLIINDDVSFGASFLEKAISFLKDKERTLLLAQFIDKKTGSIEESGMNANVKKQMFKVASSVEDINCLSTRGLFLRFSDLLEIGDFYPYLLPHYGSDYEFTLRAYRKGFSLITTPEVVICPDTSQTGFHGIETSNFLDYLFKSFSKKNVCNPIYRSVFIAFTAPKLHVPHLVFSVWIRFFISIILQLTRPSTKRSYPE